MLAHVDPILRTVVRPDDRGLRLGLGLVLPGRFPFATDTAQSFASGLLLINADLKLTMDMKLPERETSNAKKKGTFLPVAISDS